MSRVIRFSLKFHNPHHPPHFSLLSGSPFSLLQFPGCSSFLPQFRLLFSPPPSSFSRQASFSLSHFQNIAQCVWADSKRTKSSLSSLLCFLRLKGLHYRSYFSLCRLSARISQHSSSLLPSVLRSTFSLSYVDSQFSAWIVSPVAQMLLVLFESSGSVSNALD